MLSGPDAFVAAGFEPFIDLSMGYRGSRRNMRTRMGTNMGSRLSMQSRLQSRKDRLSKTSEWLDNVMARLVAEYSFNLNIMLFVSQCWSL